MNSKNIAITIIVAIIFAGGGFYGGMQYANNSAAAQKSARNGGAGGGNYAMMRSGGQGRGGSAMGGANGNGGFVTGQITAVSGNDLTIQERDGSSKIVLYSGSTAIAKSVSGAASDLATGDNVMITGTTNSDGSVTAQNIQLRPAAANSGNVTPASGGPSNSGN